MWKRRAKFNPLNLIRPFEAFLLFCVINTVRGGFLFGILADGKTSLREGEGYQRCLPGGFRLLLRPGSVEAARLVSRQWAVTEYVHQNRLPATFQDRPGAVVRDGCKARFLPDARGAASVT